MPDEISPVPQQEQITFPLHRVTVVPGGIEYKIWLDNLTAISHTIPDEQFLVMFKLLKEQRKKEAAGRLEIAHAMPPLPKGIN